MGAASSSVANNMIWPHYFGSVHIGAIRGRSMQIMMLFNLRGARLAGFVKDTTGSYLPAWWAAVGGLVISAIILVFTPRPRPPDAQRLDSDLAV